MKRSLICRLCVMFAVVALVAATSGIAMGEMLFLDSYDTTAQSTTDINFEIADRTSGTYGGGFTTYNEYTDNDGTYAVGTDVLQLDGGSGKEYIWIDRNFNGSDSAGGLDFSFSAKLVMATSTDTKWFDVTIGGSNSTDHRPMLDGLCTYLRGSGDATIREYIGGATGATNFTWAGDDGSYHDFLLEIRGVGDDNPFDGVGAMTMTMYIDGSEAIAFTTTANSCTNNYIGFEVCDSATLYLENLTVSQVEVPEPSTLALLATGLFGLLAYAWKKRK